MTDPKPPARETEAYLQLLKDLNLILSNKWDDTPSDEIKRRLNAAMADSLRIYI